MALKLNSIWLFLFITDNKYIRILPIPKCTILLTYCCLHAVEYSMLFGCHVCLCLHLEFSFFSENSANTVFQILNCNTEIRYFTL